MGRQMRLMCIIIHHIIFECAALHGVMQIARRSGRLFVELL